MNIVIEPVANAGDVAAMNWIRHQVFVREMRITLKPVDEFANTNALHLLARAEPDGEPVAALTVVDTSGDRELHQSCGLEFHPAARVARYTQMAVIRPYRGMNIPLKLLVEAHHRFTEPGQYDYAWLLFDAERAASSLMCRWLAFTPTAGEFLSEYGLSRALVRDERAAHSEQAVRQTEQYLKQSLKPFSLTGISTMRQVST